MVMWNVVLPMHLKHLVPVLFANKVLSRPDEEVVTLTHLFCPFPPTMNTSVLIAVLQLYL